MSVDPQKPTKLKKSQKQSKLFGVLIFIGLFVTLIVVLAAIKVPIYETYISKDYLFKVKYPANWQVIEKPNNLGVVAFLAPKSYELDVFQENVNIAVEPAQMTTSLPRITEKIKMQVIGTFENQIEILASESIYLGSIPAYKFAHTTIDKNIENPIQYMHVWFVLNNNIMIITYAAQQDDYETYFKYFMDIAKSFRVISPQEISDAN